MGQGGEQMISAAEPNITNADVSNLLDAHRGLLEAIRNALGDFHAKSLPAGKETSNVWESRALPSLEKEQLLLDQAGQRFRQGESQPISDLAGKKLGLAKELDNFDLSWATAENRSAIESGIKQVVSISYKFFRAGK